MGAHTAPEETHPRRRLLDATTAAYRAVTTARVEMAKATMLGGVNAAERYVGDRLDAKLRAVQDALASYENLLLGNGVE